MIFLRGEESQWPLLSLDYHCLLRRGSPSGSLRLFSDSADFSSTTRRGRSRQGSDLSRYLQAAWNFLETKLFPPSPEEESEVRCSRRRLCCLSVAAARWRIYGRRRRTLQLQVQLSWSCFYPATTEPGLSVGHVAEEQGGSSLSGKKASMFWDCEKERKGETTTHKKKISWWNKAAMYD